MGGLWAPELMAPLAMAVDVCLTETAHARQLSKLKTSKTDDTCMCLHLKAPIFKICGNFRLFPSNIAAC